MSNKVKTLLYPFFVGTRLFSRFKRGKIFIYCLMWLCMFVFEGLLFFEVIYIHVLLKVLIQLYVAIGVIYIEFYFEDLDKTKSF